MQRVQSVLVVDDNPADAHYARVILERSGRYEAVSTAKRADLALTMFEHFDAFQRERPEVFPPSLILLDLNMPGMDGFQFLMQYEQARIQRPELPPVVVLTGSELSLDARRARAFDSVQDVVTKPITADIAVSLANTLTADLEDPNATLDLTRDD